MEHHLLLLHRAAPGRCSSSNSNAPVLPPIRPSFLGFPPFVTNSKTSLCHATAPPASSHPPPDPDPDPGNNNNNNNSDVGATFSKAQDKMQIFLAVLFWMSLFFWNCALDGKNDDGPNTKSRFKR